MNISMVLYVTLIVFVTGGKRKQKYKIVMIKNTARKLFGLLLSKSPIILDTGKVAGVRNQSLQIYTKIFTVFDFM